MNQYLYRIIKFVKSPYDNYCALKLRRLREPYFERLREIVKENTSVITSNCFSGRISQDLGRQYNSPTLGLFFWADDYIEFLSHLDYYLHEAKIEFQKQSKYEEGNNLRKSWKHWYPIGILGGKVEINFLHYYTEEEAAEKWYRRASRVNMDDLLVIGMEQNLCEVKHIEAFDKLPFERKVFFSLKNLSDIKSNCFLKELEGEIGNVYDNAHILYKHMCEIF